MLQRSRPANKSKQNKQNKRQAEPTGSTCLFYLQEKEKRFGVQGTFLKSPLVAPQREILRIGAHASFHYVSLHSNLRVKFSFARCVRAILLRKTRKVCLQKLRKYKTSGTRPESAANADEVALRKACNRTFRGRNLAYSYPIIFLDSFIGCDILLSQAKETQKAADTVFSFGNLWLLLFIVLLQACAGLC